MALEASDLNDNQILQTTKQETNPAGQIRFTITMPSGRLLTSEWMRREDASGKTVIAWCQAVRDNAVADAQEQEIKDRRNMAPPSAGELLREDLERTRVPKDMAEYAPHPKAVRHVDPLEFAKQHLASLQERLDVLDGRIEADTRDRILTSEERAKWKRIVEGLEGAGQ